MIKLPHKRTEIRLSREDAIIAYCARLDLDNERRASIKQQINEGVDWELLLYRAGWQRLSPLVSYHLVSPDMNMLVPESVRKKLQNILFMSLARNMLLQEELSNILAVLNKEEIPVVLLKGAALLQDVYTDIAVRPMSDLDIMVKPENMNRTENILLKQGYEYSENIVNGQEYVLNHRHLPNLWNRRKGIMLEVHRHIVDSDSPYNLELEDFWARARCIKVKNNDALVLSPEDTMIHLSINFLSDRRFYSNSALGQLVDLSELILHYNDSLRWNLIEQIAINFKFTTGLHCVLYACAQLLSSDTRNCYAMPSTTRLQSRGGKSFLPPTCSRVQTMAGA